MEKLLVRRLPHFEGIIAECDDTILPDLIPFLVYTAPERELRVEGWACKIDAVAVRLRLLADLKLCFHLCYSLG